MKKDTQEKSALEFIDDFKKMIEENDVQQRRVTALAEEENELTASIAKLKAEFDEIKQRIARNEQESIARIKAAQENADRVFRQEEARHAKVDLDQAKRQAMIDELEPKLRQQKAEQDQREIDLLSFGKKLKRLEIDAEEAQEEATRIKQENILNSAKIATERASLAQERANLEQGKRDLNEHLHIYKNGCIELQHKETEIRQMRETLNNDIAAVKAEKDKLAEEYSDLAKRQKEIDRQNVMLDEKRKNNDDKERALKTMAIEIDYKLARLDKIKGQRND